MKKEVKPKSETKEMFAFTVEQVQSLGNYLVTRPYGEVEKLIELLKNAPKVNVTFTEPPAPEAPVVGEDSPPESVTV